MTNPHAPRDIDLTEWLRSIGFHPADTDLKRLSHEAVRALIGELGAHLHYILPPGEDKTHTFRQLRDVLMWANATLAVGGGPDPDKVTAGSLWALQHHALGDAARPSDPRVADVPSESQQPAEPARPEGYRSPFKPVGHEGEHHALRFHPEHQDTPAAPVSVNGPAERSPLVPEKPFTRFRYSTGEAPDMVRTFEVKFQDHWVDPAVTISVEHHHEAENIHSVRGTLDVDSPEVLDEIAAGITAAAKRLRRHPAGR